MADGEIADAFARLDLDLSNAGEPAATADLAPALTSTERGERLGSLDVAVHPSVVEWFGLHNGGWVNAVKWNLLGLDQALDARRELRAALGGAEDVAHWMPFMVDSVETYVVDMSTGSVLCYDLVAGLSQHAPSLSRWIDDAWEDTTSPIIALPTPEATQLEPRIDGAARVATYPEPAWWDAQAGTEVVEGVFVAEDTVVVLTKEDTGGAVHILAYSDNQLLPNGPPLLVPGPFSWRPLVMSPNKRFAIVNNGWLLDVANRELVAISALATHDSRSKLGIDWSADSSTARASYGDDVNILVDATSRTAQKLPPQTRLLDHYLITLSPDQDVLEVAAINASTNCAIRASSLGWQTLGAWTSLGNGQAVVSGAAGIALVDLRTGESRQITDPPLRFAMQSPGGALFAAQLDWPTDQIYQIFPDGQPAQPVGLPQADNSRLIHGPRETALIAHHVHLESGKLAIELLNVDTGHNAVLPLRASPQTDLYYDLHITPSFVLFDDVNSQGIIEPFAAEITSNGQFGRVAPLGDSTKLQAGLCVSGDSNTAAWRDAGGLSWCAINGDAVNRYDGAGQLQWKPEPAKKYVTASGRVLVRETSRVGIAGTGTPSR